jgi:hypothetical protein
MHAGREDLHACGARLLRPVHRDVGIAQKVVGLLVGVLRQRDPDTRGREHVLALQLERVRQPLLDAPRRVHGIVGVLDLQEDGELIATQARNRLVRAHARPERARDAHEQGIADGMAEAVVHDLEAIQIHEQNGTALLRLAAPARQRRRQPINEQRAVRQTRQRVVQRIVAQTLLRLLAVGDVVNDALVAAYLHVVVEALGRRQQTAQLNAVAPPQAHFHLARVPPALQLALHQVPVTRVGEQEVELAAVQLLDAVPEQLDESCVALHNRTVAVRDVERVTRLLEQGTVAPLAQAQRTHCGASLRFRVLLLQRVPDRAHQQRVIDLVRQHVVLRSLLHRLQRDVLVLRRRSDDDRSCRRNRLQQRKRRQSARIPAAQIQQNDVGSRVPDEALGPGDRAGGLYVESWRTLTLQHPAEGRNTVGVGVDQQHPDGT